MDMKLAEALIIRADLQTRLRELRDRLCANALVQERASGRGADGALEQLEKCCLELSTIMTRINLTNTGTIVSGNSLTELLARRETLALRVSAMRSLSESASNTAMRASRSEVKILSSVDVQALRRETDELSRELRELDTSIQSANRTIDLS